MQRRKAKIGLRDRRCHQRPNGRNDTRENPPRNGLFGVGPGIRGSVGLDGGVRSQIRTRLDRDLPDKWLFAGYFGELVPVIENAPRISAPFQWLTGQFPTNKNRALPPLSGYISLKTGGVASRTGISGTLQKNSHRLYLFPLLR